MKDIGCPAPPLQLPRCAPQPDTYTLAQVEAQAKALEDHFITIRASILPVDHHVQLAGCISAGPCCINKAWADVGFRRKHAKGGDDFEVRLWDHEHPDRFKSIGDDSALCGEVSSDGRIVEATGVLRSYVQLEAMTMHGHPVWWFLDDAEVCELKE